MCGYRVYVFVVLFCLSVYRAAMEYTHASSLSQPMLLMNDSSSLDIGERSDNHEEEEDYDWKRGR